ncbi:uncharacterized protein LOC135198800 [Macrobrachium nipponense]|uniref:uncharacterized protein LOC135198800 n=1 Tax=Macrobrachium nipponense TaxID=159736 RepID=UPI0030C866C9
MLAKFALLLAVILSDPQSSIGGLLGGSGGGGGGGSLFFVPSSNFNPVGSNPGSKPFLVSPTTNFDGSPIVGGGLGSQGGSNVVVGGGGFVSQGGSNVAGGSFGGNQAGSGSRPVVNQVDNFGLNVNPNSGFQSSGGSFLGGQNFVSGGYSSGDSNVVLTGSNTRITGSGSSGSNLGGGNVFGGSSGGSNLGGGNVFGGSSGGSNLLGGNVFGGSSGGSNLGGGNVFGGSSGGSNLGSGNVFGSTGGLFIGSGISGGSGTFNVGVDGTGFGTSSGPQVLVNQGPVRQSFGTFGSQGVQVNQNFAQLLEQITLTVTLTNTIDRFVTVTETVLNSVPITITGFNVNTVTVTTQGVQQTSANDVVVLTSTVEQRPITSFVTTAKSNHLYVTDISVEIFTITHSAHQIDQTTFTTVVTQTLTLSSPIVRTSIITSLQTNTVYQTIVNTAFVRGGYGY